MTASAFYSKTTGGFYIPGIHETMPDDAVEISEARRVELMDGQAKGKRIEPNSDGLPVLVERVVTDEQRVAAQLRKASAYLAETDWYITRMAETGKEIPPDVLALRAAARELL